jgi:hypothetical protein
LHHLLHLRRAGKHHQTAGSLIHGVDGIDRLGGSTFPQALDRPTHTKFQRVVFETVLVKGQHHRGFVDDDEIAVNEHDGLFVKVTHGSTARSAHSDLKKRAFFVTLAGIIDASAIEEDFAGTNPAFDGLPTGLRLDILAQKCGDGLSTVLGGQVE